MSMPTWTKARGMGNEAGQRASGSLEHHKGRDLHVGLLVPRGQLCLLLVSAWGQESVLE